MKGLAATLALLLPAVLVGSPAGGQTAPAPPGPEAAADGGGAMASLAQRDPAYAFAVAKLLLEEGSYREALEGLRAVSERVPEDPWVHLELAELLYRLGRTRPALAEAEQAFRLAADDPDMLLAVGRLYAALGDQRGESHPMAKGVFERLLALQPGDPDALHALGRLYQREGDLARAEEYFRELVAQRPGARTANPLLEVLLEQEKPEEAVALLRDLVVQNPEELELRFTLADLLAEAGDHAGAAEVLQGAPAAQRQHPDLMRRLTLELYRSGQGEQASALLDETSGEESDPRLRLFHALLLVEQGRGEEALSQLRRLRQQHPDDVEIGLATARVMAGLDRGEEAAGELRQLATRLRTARPVDALRVRLQLAELLANLGRLAEAAQMAAEVAGAAPPELAQAARLLEAEALIALDRPEEAARRLTGLPLLQEVPLAAKRAELLFRTGREREAARQIDELVGRDDGRAAAIEVLQRVERYDESIPLLEALLADDPDAVQAMFMLGAAFERTGQLPEAVGVFRDLIELQPDFHLALNYLGYMWADNGENLPEAQELIERALELDPGNAAYLDSLGWVYHRRGRHAEALEPLRRAAELVPDDGTIQEHLGDVHRALGDIAGAREAYRRAVELEDENLPEVQRKLADLEQGGPAKTPRAQ